MANSIIDQITQTATQLGVDPNLAIAVATQESSLNPSAISPKGAIGLFQLLPSTAAGLGVNPNDIPQNITGGITYLKQMLDQFGGNISLALAAYNSGPGNVQKYNGIPPFSETQNYVSSILGMLGISSTSDSQVASTVDNFANTDSLGSPIDTMSGSSGSDSTLAMVALVGLGIWMGIKALNS